MIQQIQAAFPDDDPYKGHAFHWTDYSDSPDEPLFAGKRWSEIPGEVLNRIPDFWHMERRAQVFFLPAFLIHFLRTQPEDDIFMLHVWILFSLTPAHSFMIDRSFKPRLLPAQRAVVRDFFTHYAEFCHEVDGSDHDDIADAVRYWDEAAQEES